MSFLKQMLLTLAMIPSVLSFILTRPLMISNHNIVLGDQNELWTPRHSELYPPKKCSNSSQEEEEPGRMRVLEIKSELDLRGVDYSDCFDKENLAQKLVQARASGKADPSIIDQFNKQLENNDLKDGLTIDSDIIEEAVASDGTLPGGMPPDMLNKLMSNPELVGLMSNPKLQEVMKLMMTGGQDALEREMQNDKQIRELIIKLNTIMQDVI